MVSGMPQDDEFERIVQGLNIEIPQDAQERMDLISEETRTGIIHTREHFMTIVMDHDPETSIQQWRFIAKCDREAVRSILKKLLEDWAE